MSNKKDKVFITWFALTAINTLLSAALLVVIVLGK